MPDSSIVFPSFQMLAFGLIADHSVSQAQQGFNPERLLLLNLATLRDKVLVDE